MEIFEFSNTIAEMGADHAEDGRSLCCEGPVTLTDDGDMLCNSCRSTVTA